MANSQNYCYECAIRLGKITPVIATPESNSNLTSSDYQLRKFIKHTMPQSYDGLLSIFDRSEYSDYYNYTVSGSLSGSVQIDEKGRTSLVWYAGEHTGMTFENGHYYCADDSIKIVLSHDITHIHSFPANWERHYITKCLICDRAILS